MVNHDNQNNLFGFSQKVLIATGIVSLFIVMLLILKTAFSVILLVLAGIIIAVYFRGFSYWIADRFKISERLSLVIVISLTILMFGLFSLLIGTRISSQISQLTEELPNYLNKLKEQISHYSWGKNISGYVERLQKIGSGGEGVNWFKNFFKTTFGVLGDIYLILFLGLFFTISPLLYRNSILSLVPTSKEKEANQVLKRVGLTLRSWLAGQILAMIIVTILTAIGLFILGVPMALALAVIAGFLNFIPNFGPIIALFPAALVALSQDPMTALIVIVLYIGIQVIESNFITPYIQKSLIEIPPAYIIIGQVTMGILAGALGLILATPLIAILMTLIKSIYIERILKKHS